MTGTIGACTASIRVASCVTRLRHDSVASTCEALAYSIELDASSERAHDSPPRLLPARSSSPLRPRSSPTAAGAAARRPSSSSASRSAPTTSWSRWDKIVDYMKLAAASSDRVRFRELGKTSDGNPFIALEISAPDTLKNLDRYKQLERKLYFQGGAPTDAERDEIFRQGKARACSSPAASTRPRSARRRCRSSSCTGSRPTTRRDVKKILDNVIFVLVPSLNPDGQIMVTDWFNKNLGTPYANSPIPVPLSPVRRPRQQPRHVHVHAEGEPAHGAAAVARLVPVGVARRAPDGQQRRAHLRDAGDRSDQPERAPAHLPLERHPRPVAGGGARGGRQGRHHLQLHLHELLGRRDGVERLVAQPDRPAHRGGERARRRADRSAARRARRAPAAGRARGRGGRRRPRSATRRPAAAPRPTSTRAPSIRVPGWAATGRSATSSTTS